MARPPLELLPYFWPLTELEIQTLQSSIDIRWAADPIESNADVQQWRLGLDRVRTSPRSGAEHAVVLFTMNDCTRHWAAAVAAASREGGADEMMVFKDPAIPPYLCDQPALQKGFRRPPP